MGIFAILHTVMKKAVLFRGARISYRLDGSGPCVFLIHGFGMDSRIWKNVLPGFEDCQVIRIDLPGFGKSGILEAYQIEDLAGLIHRILSAERIGRCMMFGHSMGGYAALSFAEQWPDKLKGLGLVHSHCYADDQQVLEKRQKTADFVLRQGVEPYVQRFVPGLYGSKFRKKQKNRIEKMIARGLAYSPLAYAAGHQAMAMRPDRSHVLASLSIPVLFCIGREDETLAFEKSMTQTVLPAQSQIELFKKSGHMGMQEQPKRMRRAFRRFLRFCSQMQERN